MSIQGRNRRKKTFKPSEEIKIEEPSNVFVKQERVPSTLLNVRRSSRKPKPKQRDDEEMLFTERETTEKDNEGGSVDALVGFEGLESSKNMYLGTGVRRETRKTYQNYLETLGYNTDFSKITAQESAEQAAKPKVASSQRTIRKQSKPEEKLTPKQTIHIKTEPPDLPEEKYLSPKVRASSRTPKPKRTFALLEDDSAVSLKQTRASILENVSDSHSETEMKLTVLAKPRKSLPESSDKEQKSRKSHRHANFSLVHNVLTTTPLSKQDVDKTEPDEHDSSLTRTSTRVRIPKRKFSLIDEESPETEAKRQRVMSPEQAINCKVEDSKILLDKIQEDSNTNIHSHSSLVIKRSDSKKQRGNRRKEETRESRVDHGQEKEENISKKTEVFSSNSSHSESEKKPEGKRRRPRIEAIVQKLKISKDASLKQASKKTNIDKKTEVEEKSSTSRKTVKRKRETSSLEKSGSEKEEKRNINDSKEEHIVLKLTIPHGSPKTEEKKHHHKHHHKHKREKEGEIGVNKKKIKSEGEEDVAKSKETSSKVSGKLESDIKTKKKKRKSGNKEDSSESLSSDTSALPHVKLVIKKSPVKSKSAAVTMKDDPSASIEPSLISQDEAVEQNTQSDQSDSKKKVDEQTGSKKKKDDQSDLKKKTQTKKDKPLSKREKKRLEKLKKDAKTKTVSAYSLFTKSRRKHLLETEPDLDFATTSRRLAEMWKELPGDDQEYWRAKARVIRKPELDRKSSLKSKARSSTTKGRHDYSSGSHSKDAEAFLSSGTDVVDMAAYLKLLGESLCSIGMCLKRQDQMEVHGSLSVLLDTALCSIVPLFCLTSQFPEMAGCSAQTQAEILDNLAYIIPGL